MIRIRVFVAGLGVAFAVAAAPAQAQVAFGIAGGATLPSGDLNDRQNLGYNGLATVQLAVPLFPLQFRADLQYNSFGGKNWRNAVNQAVAKADTRVISGTINGVFSLLPGPIKPYLIGGIGYYDTEVMGNDNTRKLGYNYGAGVKFGLTRTSIFIEGRMHQIKDAVVNVGGGRTSAKFIPITVGIMF
jgi:opacity protein-like surface antigen